MAERILGYDSDQLNNTAKRVVQLSEESKNTVKTIRGDMENLKASWKGDVSDTLMKNIEDEINAIEKDLERFYNVGSNLGDQAKSLNELDETHKNSINSVSY